VTAGKDAVAEVTVRVVHDGIESLGQAASKDTIEATLKAYLSAVASAREARAAA
jgi:LeuA allosteric (dimerisation) domain